MSCATLKTYLRSDIVTFQEGHVLNDQAHHSLTVFVGSLWFVP